MKKSLFIVMSLLVMLSMLLSACAPADGDAGCRPSRPTSRREPTQAPASHRPGRSRPRRQPLQRRPRPLAPTPVVVPAGRTRTDFWHSMGGDIGGKAIPQLAGDFNASQDKCFVVPTYQGSYDDSLNKLKAGLQSKDVPAVVQLFDIGTRLLVDLKVATPVQDFIDKEKYDVSDLEPTSWRTTRWTASSGPCRSTPPTR